MVPAIGGILLYLYGFEITGLLLFIYWFQAYDKTSPGTFMQKVNNFLIKLKGDTGHNAFVRVTVPINNNDLARAYQTGVDYIKVFYPPFLQFIKT